MSSYENKTIRAPSLKRGKTDGRLNDRIKLKKVLGLTVCSNAALDVVPNTGVIVYPAGCTTVFFNAKKLTQSYILNTSKKAITSIAISSCGRYLATGECGINPAIKVWELDHANENNLGALVAEFLGHKYAISCVAFSPTAKYLVSVGSQHDMIINVFEWKANLKIASNKVSAKVSAVSFNNDGNYFVTVGNRHVKYWYLERNRKSKEPIPLMGRSAILGELRNNDFCAVACGKDDCAGSTYAITRVGHLVEFNARRLLDKFVACRTNSANCISVNSNYILVGCAEAIIRIFNSITLEYITTLPRTHYLGVDVAQGLHINHIMAAPTSAKYPDTIAMVFDETRNKVICVYNDHSLYIWDLRDIKRVGKSQSFLYHSACIWGVETVPSNNVDIDIKSDILPIESFLTCSSDDTIRVWGFDGCQNNLIYRKNIYSKELLKILYIDNELNYIKDNDNPILNTDKSSSSYDGRNGVRCIKICPYKEHLATGDRSGNIRVYSLNYSKLVKMIEAHDSEVLCLEYTNGKYEHKLLASASRDRLIHVFDVEKNYKIVQTLDDHSSSITSVKFVCIDGNLQMISCGADKSIMFRYFQNEQFVRGINCSGKTTLYDMEIDSNSKHVLTACQDRFIRIYGTQNAKHTKTFKGSYSSDGSLIKLCLDPSGIYVATSCTDKTLAVFDYYSTECMAKMYGHSELVTGLRFSNDCQYLISASGDGCIFIWQMPHDMVVTMQARLSQQRLRSDHQAATRNISSPIAEISPDMQIEKEMVFFDTDSPGYKFSDVGQLPLWAKRKTSATDSQINFPNLSTSPNQQNIGIAKPRGRWAQRGQIEPDTLTHRSNSESPISVNFHQIQTSDYNSGSSKEVFFNQNHYLSEDSSIDSGLDAKKELFNQNKISHNENNKINKLEPNNEHDGDVEDISDGERTSSDHGLFYPNQFQASPMDFKVNAMNEDELRKSVRKQKFEKAKLNLSGLTPPIITTGTSDTEDEGSTPSGDNAERSLGSTLGGSYENIPQQLPSNFLQAALDGPGQLNDRSDRSRRSISAKHNIENKNNLPKSYTSSKKEELMKVINDAKQKLETVGYRSNLRGSQSISDLSHFTNLDNSAKASRIAKQGNARNSKLLSVEDSSIRRACSLSDLCLAKGTGSIGQSAQKVSPPVRTNGPPRTFRKNSFQNIKSSNGMHGRSFSVGILHQASDSETDPQMYRSNGTKLNAVTRHSSGTGQTRLSSSKSSNPILPRRKGLQSSYSSVNLSTTHHDDSSSEEISSGPSYKSGKPSVPPRPKNLVPDIRLLPTNIPNISKIRGTLDTINQHQNENATDTKITPQMCSNVITMLNTTANAVLQLYSRLKNNKESTLSRNNNSMIIELENAAVMTKNMLTNMTENKDFDNNTNPTTQLLDGQSSIDNGDYVLMLNDCAEIIKNLSKLRLENNKLNEYDENN